MNVRSFDFSLYYRKFALLCFALCALVLTFVLHQSARKIGEPFPGYLLLKNGLVGPYFLPDWQPASLSRESAQTLTSHSPLIFSQEDYLGVVLVPALSGFLFLILGILACSSLPHFPGQLVLLGFHFFVAVYLIASPDFHLTYRIWFLHLLAFAFLPASMIHFAFLFPEIHRDFGPGKILSIVPYLFSAAIAFPSLLFFFSPSRWMVMERILSFYALGAYLFWISRLLWVLKKPLRAIDRIIARYFLGAQILTLILFSAGWLMAHDGRFSIPLNLATPLILIFPILLFIGVLSARLRQSQAQLVQSEKRVLLGTMVSGLVHELNNPITFVYSNLEPLQERLGQLRKGNPASPSTIQEIEEISRDIEEGATRALKILENFRYFAHPGSSQIEKVDLNDLLEECLLLLTPKWKNRIVVQKQFSSLPLFSANRLELGQVFVNLVANACDAMEEKGILQLSTEQLFNQLIVKIRDSGMGICKEDLGRIFDPFYTTKAPGEGTGLGLTIALEIVKKYGGELEVKSEIRKGTEFIVTFRV